VKAEGLITSNEAGTVMMLVAAGGVPRIRGVLRIPIVLPMRGGDAARAVDHIRDKTGMPKVILQAGAAGVVMAAGANPTAAGRVTAGTSRAAAAAGESSNDFYSNGEQIGCVNGPICLSSH
jgi:hypothetical protein